MLVLILVVLALVFGIVAEVLTKGRDLAAWGVICLAAVHLLANVNVNVRL